MGLETATYINDLDANNPDGADQRSQGDNHLRMLKSVLKATFPGLAGRSFRVQTKAGNYGAVVNDNTSLLYFSAAATLQLSAAATLGNGYLVMAYAAVAEVIVDPSGAELINGGATFNIPAGQLALIFCDGAGFSAFTIPALAPAWSTGDVKPTFKAVADPGWVLMNDGTIGSGSSGGTTRANVDCEKLFILLWNNVSNAWAPVSGGRGGSASSDWGLNKTIGLPKALGRALSVAGAGSGLTSRALGETLGAETHTLTQAETPLKSHAHAVTDPGHAHNINLQFPFFGTLGGQLDGAKQTGSQTASESAGTGISIQNFGDASASAHNNMPPETFLNVMIKL
jgi:microcystin-dependent protein